MRLFHSGAEGRKDETGNEKGNRDGNGDLSSLFFFDSSGDGADFGDFVVFVIADAGMEHRGKAEDEQHDAEDEQKTLHGSECIIAGAFLGRLKGGQPAG